MSNYNYSYQQQNPGQVGFSGFAEPPPAYSGASSYPSAPPVANSGGYSQQYGQGNYAAAPANISGVYVPPAQGQQVYEEYSPGPSYGGAGYYTEDQGRRTKSSGGGAFGDVGKFASKNKLEIAGAALSYKMGGTLGKVMAAGMGADLVNRYQKEHKNRPKSQPHDYGGEYSNYSTQKQSGVKSHGVAGDLMSTGQQLLGKTQKYVGGFVGGGTGKQELNSGCVVQLMSRVTGKPLQVVMAGDGRLVLDALGPDNPQAFNTHFTVIKEGEKVIMLHNNYNYVSIMNGRLTVFMAGQGGQPSHHCRFRIHEPQHKSVSLESLAEPSCCIGILPNGHPTVVGGSRHDEYTNLFNVRTVYNPYK